MRASGKYAPVFRGSDRALAKTLNKERADYAPRVQEALDGIARESRVFANSLPPAGGAAQSAVSVEFYIDCLGRAERPVTVVLLGPATNLALALLAKPSIAEGIRRVLFAAGGCGETDITPSAEGNVWCDPEAAQHLVARALPLIFVPLDAARACSGALAAVAGSTPFSGAAKGAFDGARSLNALLAVCAAADERALRDVKKVFCTVGLRDYSEGQTILDPRYYTPEKNCSFALSADGGRVEELLAQCLEPKRRA